MKEYFKKNKHKILVLVAVCVPVAAFYLTLGCPLRFFTGICCPGCGMSRALWYILKLDFPTAFNMHPLIFIMPVAVLIYIFREKIPKKLYTALIIAFFSLMAVTYILRLISGSDVVYIDPQRGFISKIIQLITGGI